MKKNVGMTAKEQTGVRCAHYWLIDGRNIGVCKYCGDVKKFPGGGDIDLFMLPGPGRYNWDRKQGKVKSGLGT